MRRPSNTLAVLALLALALGLQGCGIVGRFASYNAEFGGGDLFKSTHVSVEFARTTDVWWKLVSEPDDEVTLNAAEYWTSTLYRFPGIGLISVVDVLLSLAFDLPMMPIDALHGGMTSGFPASGQEPFDAGRLRY